MIGGGLAELGRELCQEFDNKRNELNALQEETVSMIKEQRAHSWRQEKADRAERRAECGCLKANVVELLAQYRSERERSWQEWRDALTAQRRELQAWNKERRADYKAWHEAVRYVRTKRSRG